MPNARFVEQADWDKPEREAWIGAIVAACEAAERPVLLIAHSLGVIALAHAAERLRPEQIKGAFLVGPPSDKALLAVGAADFAPAPTAPLPFPSLLVASRDDPYGDFEESKRKALAWGSRLYDAGASGHINIGCGHGPWPEGAMRLAGFVKQL